MLNLKKIILSILLLYTFTASAQESAVKVPKKAGLYSAIIPGAGQVYAEKYWKIPIIYAGLATSAYYFKESNDYYNHYKDAYLNRIAGDNSDNINYTDAQLREAIDLSRRNREISALLFTMTYILNIVDASVSAHLFEYDVSEDISLRIQPVYMAKENASGLSLSFKL